MGSIKSGNRLKGKARRESEQHYIGKVISPRLRGSVRRLGRPRGTHVSYQR